MTIKKTVAFVSTMEGVPWGGSEELWSLTAEKFLAHGFFVAANVKGFDCVRAPLKRLRLKGCSITFRRHQPPAGIPTRLARRFISRSLKDPFGVWLDKVRPDLAIISQGCNCDGAWWMLECKKRSINYVTIAQSAASFYWPSDNIVAQCAEAYQGTMACFFVSNANRRLTELQLGTDLPRAEIVRNPFNVSYDAELPWPPAEPRYRLACVGRLDPLAKGQDLLCEVMSLKKWRNRPLEIIFYGDGIRERGLRNLKQYLDLTNVTFAGFTDRSEEIWGQCHGLILASRMEGLPLALVEAMLCGRLSIATDIGGNAEVIEDNVSGFIAKAPSVELIDEALERAWQRRDEWEAIGKVAAKKIRELIPRDPVQIFFDKLLTYLDRN